MAYKIPFINPANLVSFTVKNVNGNVVGNTLMGTSAAGQTFLPVLCVYTLVAASGGTATSGPSISAGITPTFYIDILSFNSFNISVGQAFTTPIITRGRVPGSSQIFLSIHGASNWTTYTFNFSLAGYYV